MKKLLLGLFSLLLTVSFVTAQDGMTALKDATKAMTKYQQETDAAKKATNLIDAAAAIDLASDAASSIEEKNQIKLWQTKGEIYNEVVRMAVNKKIQDPTYESDDLSAGLKAFEAFKMAMEKGTKKWHKNEAITGLVEASSYVSNAGRLMYGDKNYEGALANFNAVTSMRELLNANGNTDVLTEAADYNEHIFMSAITALTSKKNDVARPLFEKLLAADYNKAVTYEGLFRTTVEEDEAKALEYLSMGRKKFPDDEGLRVSEINYYIQAGKLDDLVGTLKAAIEKDPNNISYYSVLGKVYDDLYQKESGEGGDATKAQSHFDNALSYYNQALEKDGTFFSAIYNIGALYYNKAAILTKDLITLESDYSKEGTRKYKAKQGDVLAMFDKALPFFQKAEAIDANDVSTLIALKEIYAKKDDLTMSNEFKARIEKAEAGDKNDSYFKK